MITHGSVAGDLDRALEFALVNFVRVVRAGGPRRRRLTRPAGEGPQA
ncbi:hypothetical protein TOK_3610 [Pseudonocardia sp. N23]|nr:hypothetical protein TOK_3610 [Pseudonocardia sp. N23]